MHWTSQIDFYCSSLLQDSETEFFCIVDFSCSLGSIAFLHPYQVSQAVTHLAELYSRRTLVACQFLHDFGCTRFCFKGIT
jgi:hypothetical protein